MTGLIGINPLKRIAEWLMFEPVLTGFNQLALEFIPGRDRSKTQKLINKMAAIESPFTSKFSLN
jgi:hypothetical protein